MKNTRFITTIALLVIGCLTVARTDAQTMTSGCDLTVKINGYQNDTLWFGHTFGKRGKPDFSVVKNIDGSFNIRSDEELPAGMYAILYKRGKASSDFEYFCIWLSDRERRFSIETNLAHLYPDARFEGSLENEWLFRYLTRFEKMSDSLNNYTNNWKSLRTEAAFREMVRIQEDLRQFQETTIVACAQTAPLTAKLLRQTLFLTPPTNADDGKNWQTEAVERHYWMRNHYFDHMDLGSGQFLKFPLWIQRADYFFNRLPPPDPDSMVSMVEELWRRLEPDSIAHQYYFQYIMNSLSRISRYRTDEAFVFLVKKYVEGGRADFLTKDRREKYLDDAKRLEPLFVGKKVPDATFLDKNATPQTLYEITAPYTLMVFWLHDCGHCKREIPIVRQLHEHWKTKGLHVFSVCGSSGEDNTAACYEFAERIEMPSDWTVVNDPLRRSRFSRLYNVSSYPRMILLDAEKQVLFKHTGEATAEMLEAEFERAIR